MQVATRSTEAMNQHFIADDGCTWCSLENGATLRCQYEEKNRVAGRASSPIITSPVTRVICKTEALWDDSMANFSIKLVQCIDLPVALLLTNVECDRTGGPLAPDCQISPTDHSVGV